MPSIIITILIITLVSYILNTLAPTLLNDILWYMYTHLSPPHRHLLSHHNTLRHELIDVRTSLNNTSAQKEFAKWAKLRRRHDDVQSKYESAAKELSTSKALFTAKTRVLRWLLTTGIRWAVGVYWIKEAVVWVPKGWVPRYVEGLLAFPAAPAGAVSVQVWGMACQVVVDGVVGKVGVEGVGGWVGGIVEERRRRRREEVKRKAKEREMAAAVGVGVGGEGDAKKEL